MQRRHGPSCRDYTSIERDGEGERGEGREEEEDEEQGRRPYQHSSLASSHGFETKDRGREGGNRRKIRGEGEEQGSKVGPTM